MSVHMLRRAASSGRGVRGAVPIDVQRQKSLQVSLLDEASPASRPFEIVILITRCLLLSVIERRLRRLGSLRSAFQYKVRSPGHSSINADRLVVRGWFVSGITKAGNGLRPAQGFADTAVDSASIALSRTNRRHYQSY